MDGRIGCVGDEARGLRRAGRVSHGLGQHGGLCFGTRQEGVATQYVRAKGDQGWVGRAGDVSRDDRVRRDERSGGSTGRRPSLLRAHLDCGRRID